MSDKKLEPSTAEKKESKEQSSSSHTREASADSKPEKTGSQKGSSTGSAKGKSNKGRVKKHGSLKSTKSSSKLKRAHSRKTTNYHSIHKVDPSKRSNAFLTAQRQWMEDLCNNAEMHDTKFLIGPKAQPFYGHRHHLGNISSWFYEQLFEIHEDKVKAEEPIAFPDIKPAVFKCVLRAAYHLNPGLKPENVLDVFQACQTFEIKPLVDECLRYLQEAIDGKNVLQIYNVAFTLDCLSEDLEERCLKVILQQSNVVLDTDYFVRLHPSVVEKLVRAPFFRVKEEDLFQSVYEWALYTARKSLHPSEFDLDGIDKIPLNGRTLEERLLWVPEKYIVRGGAKTSRPKSNKRRGGGDKGKGGDEKDDKKRASDDEESSSSSSSGSDTESSSDDSESSRSRVRRKKRDFRETLDDEMRDWLEPLLKHFRYPLMKPDFFIDRVRHFLERDDSEEVLIHYIDPQKRKTKFRTYPRNMSQEIGLTQGFDVIYASIEYDAAKSLLNIRSDSRWAYRALEKHPVQYFIVDIKIHSVTKYVRVRMGHDDIDCIKDFEVYSLVTDKWDNRYTEWDPEWWQHVLSLTSDQTTDWQEFRNDIKPELASRYWMFRIMSTYGRFTTLNRMQLGCPCNLRKLVDLYDSTFDQQNQ